MMGKAIIRSATITLMLLFALILIKSTAVAEVHPGLDDSFIKGNYSWAIYVDQNEIDHVMNYTCSHLHPLTQVRLSFKKYNPSDSENNSPRSGTYEELWYFRGNPVGSKRHIQLQLPQQRTGVVVVRQIGSNQEQSRAVANAVLRILVDLQIRDLSPSYILVPDNHYEAIISGIQHYRFVKLTDALQNTFSGPQLTLKVRSYPGAQEEILCYQK